MIDARVHLLSLFAGYAGLLIAFTLAGRALKHASADTAMVRNFNARVYAWWIMAGLGSLALLAGRPGVILLFAICSFAAMREFLRLTRFHKADRWAVAAAVYGALPMQYALVWMDWYALYSIFIPVYAFLVLPVLATLGGEPRDFLARIAEVQWALMICVYCLSHVPALLYLDIPGFKGGNVLLVAFLIVVVQFSDVMQYVWGKLVGRHKLAPAVSPSKTVEGAVGGVLTASLLGAALWWMTPFAPWQAGLLALAINLMGLLGGLVMSAIKRDRGVKDWGSLIPGHGGVIDRLDSVMFSAPIFFHLTRYGWSVS